MGFFGNTPVQLTTDPFVLPFPTGANGQIGYYDRGAPLGRETVICKSTENGRWQQSDVNLFPVQSLSTLVHHFTAQDPDADNTYALAYSDGGQVSTIANKYGSGNKLTTVSGGAGFTNPVLAKPCFNGRNAFYSCGNNQHMTWTNSAVDFKTLWNSGNGEFMLLLNPGWNFSATTQNILGNTVIGTENGFQLFLQSVTNQPGIVIGGSQTIKFFNCTTSALTPGKLSLLNVWLDGTNINFGTNTTGSGTGEEQSALTVAGFQAGNGARDCTMWINNPAAGITVGTGYNGFLAEFLFWSAPIGKAARMQQISDIRRYYRM